MSQKSMVILVGIPGSGKSTLARHMAEAAQAEGKTCVICSTDDFFVVDGVYKFEPEKLFKNHKQNHGKARQACSDGVQLVVIDNTNIRREHRQVYEDIATDFGYGSETIVVGEFTDDFAQICAQRNQHNVPLASIQKMARSIQLPETKQ